MWPFSSPPDPGMAARIAAAGAGGTAPGATAAGGVASGSPAVDAVRAAMGGSRVGGAFRAAAPWMRGAGYVGAGLALANEALNPSKETQAAAAAAADDIRTRFGRSTVEGIASLPRHAAVVGGTAGYQGIVAPMLGTVGAAARGLFGLDPPAEPTGAKGERMRPAPLTSAEAQAQLARGEMGGTKEATAAQAAAARPPGMFYGLTREQVNQGLEGIPLRAALPLMANMVGRTPTAPPRPTGRDMREMLAVNLANAQLAAIQQQRAAHQINDAQAQSATAELLKQLLGANPLNYAVSERIQAGE